MLCLQRWSSPVRPVGTGHDMPWPIPCRTFGHWSLRGRGMTVDMKTMQHWNVLKPFSLQVIGAGALSMLIHVRIHVDTCKLVSEHDALIVTSLHTVCKSLWYSQCSHCQPKEHAVSFAGWLLCAGPMAAPSDDCSWQSSYIQSAILLAEMRILIINSWRPRLYQDGVIQRGRKWLRSAGKLQATRIVGFWWAFKMPPVESGTWYHPPRSSGKPPFCHWGGWSLSEENQWTGRLCDAVHAQHKPSNALGAKKICLKLFFLLALWGWKSVSNRGLIRLLWGCFYSAGVCIKTDAPRAPTRRRKKMSTFVIFRWHASAFHIQVYPYCSFTYVQKLPAARPLRHHAPSTLAISQNTGTINFKL